MEFVAYIVRREGKLLPHHVRWSTKVRGELYVREALDPELNRTVRAATIETGGAFNRRVLAGPLYDVQFISAKPDWWTFTGWERVSNGINAEPTNAHRRVDDGAVLPERQR